MAFAFVPRGEVRPSRMTPKKDTSADYHVQCAAYYTALSFTAEHYRWIDRVRMHKRMYSNDQWFMDEDITAFLQDESGETINRIKIGINIIRPMVEAWRGNSINLAINAKARAISDKVITRRDLALREKMFIYDLALQMPAFRQTLSNKFNLGVTDQETKEIFQNEYVDAFTESLNFILEYVKENDKFKEKQEAAAMNLALSGLAATVGEEVSGHLRFKQLESERVFFDRSAVRSNLQDAICQGYWDMMSPSEIFESWELSSDDKKSIESWVDQYANNDGTNFQVGDMNYGNRLPIVKCFWKDIDEYWWGYVQSEYSDVPKLVKINYVEEGEEEPRYTDSDLIDPPNTPYANRIFKGRKKVKREFDTWRYCYFIPGNAIALAGTRDTPNVPLEYGVLPYQETSSDDYSEARPPIKMETWAYLDGVILSPLDDAIDPQRFINRVMSVMESQINNSGGAGMVYDKASLDPDGGEEELLSNVKNGKPVGIDSKGLGVPNNLGNYDATPKAGTYNLFNIINSLKEVVQQTTGQNDPLLGQPASNDPLVGVTKLMIQQGSLLQEPFYYAVRGLFQQMFEYTATVGKRMYISNERQLVNIVGDGNLEVIKMSKEFYNEDARVFIEMENDERMLRQVADQMLAVFYERGMISEVDYANMFGRSTPTSVARQLRSIVLKRSIEAKRKAEQESLIQEAMMERQAQNEERNRQHEAALNENDNYTKYATGTDSAQIKADAEIEGKMINQQGNNKLEGF